MSTEFRGIREHWKAWRNFLQIKLMEGGLESVAMNKLKRPDDLNAAYWNAQNVGKREKVQSAKRKEQREWDVDNEKAYAVIFTYLHKDISRQLEGQPQEGLAHLTLTYLELQYGGENDLSCLRKSNYNSFAAM